MTAVKAVRPDVAEKAQESLNKYSKDENGLRQLVKDAGGKEFLNRAANFASNAPRVRAMFQRFGVNPHTLKDQVVDNLYNNAPKQQKPSNLPVSTNNFRDRLDKLK